MKGLILIGVLLIFTVPAFAFFGRGAGFGGDSFGKPPFKTGMFGDAATEETVESGNTIQSSLGNTIQSGLGNDLKS